MQGREKKLKQQRSVSAVSLHVDHRSFLFPPTAARNAVGEDTGGRAFGGRSLPDEALCKVVLQPLRPHKFIHSFLHCIVFLL